MDQNCKLRTGKPDTNNLTTKSNQKATDIEQKTGTSSNITVPQKSSTPPTIPKDPSPRATLNPIPAPTLTQITDQGTKKDDKSIKSPIRSPSPHPLRNDDIEYHEKFSDDEDEEDDDDDEEEDEDDDSVIDKEHWVMDDNKTSSKFNTNDFLKQEIQQQNRIETKQR